MNRRGFFSAIASAVVAGVCIRRESIVAPPLRLHPEAFSLVWPQLPGSSGFAFHVSGVVETNVEYVADLASGLFIRVPPWGRRAPWGAKQPTL